MSHHKVDLHEKLLDNKEAPAHGHGHSGKGNGTLLSRIEDIKTSREFLEECTYFIGLKGKQIPT